MVYAVWVHAIDIRGEAKQGEDGLDWMVLVWSGLQHGYGVAGLPDICAMFLCLQPTYLNTSTTSSLMKSSAL